MVDKVVGNAGRYVSEIELTKIGTNGQDTNLQPSNSPPGASLLQVPTTKTVEGSTKTVEGSTSSLKRIAALLNHVIMPFVMLGALFQKLFSSAPERMPIPLSKEEISGHAVSQTRDLTVSNGNSKSRPFVESKPVEIPQKLTVENVKGALENQIGALTNAIRNPSISNDDRDCLQNHLIRLTAHQIQQKDSIRDFRGNLMKIVNEDIEVDLGAAAAELVLVQHHLKERQGRL